MLSFPMGCGFFIFFQNDDIQAGSGYPYNPIIFVHGAEKKLKKRIKKKVRQLHKNEVILNREVIGLISDALLEEWNPQPTIDAYQLDYQEALKRYRIYIEWTIQQIEDDEIALLFIFANI